MSEAVLAANEGKNLVMEVEGRRYARYAVKTHVITDKDDIVEVCQRYAGPLLQAGDTLFISEKIVACTQKRAIPMKDIHPRRLAVFLSKHVQKTPVGIGLGIPETMEMALQECGTLRILFAAFVSVIGKIFGKHGWFYHVAGEKARAIDGPCDYTLPPYNEYVVLGPTDPDEVAVRVSKALGHSVTVVDANDLGVNILGVSDPSMSRERLAAIIKDNPLDQKSQQTPLGIIRPEN